MEHFDEFRCITFATEVEDKRPTDKPRLPERPNIPWVMQEEGDA